ncbi:MAG: NAD(+)/NADH kinase [Halobacteriovoraceae bacterium]|nr:NAD(+)/NADH kinase [Halobacteriovoraceae bacterium]
MKVKKIAIILRPIGNSQFNTMVQHLCAWLIRRKIEIYFLSQEKMRLERILSSSELKKINFLEFIEIPIADIVLTLGGDGTLIGLSRNLKKTIPIVGVNWGKLGFITEFSAHEMFDALAKILRGDFKTEKRRLSKVEIYQGNLCLFKSKFVNDVVVSKSKIARLFNLNVECDKEPIFQLSGDGIVISSPLGSTAYSLAAGGPIVHPAVQAFVITPICPHSLTHRPVVISDHSVIDVNLTERESEVFLTIDGQVSKPLLHGQSVRITRETKQRLLIVLNPEKTYFHTLKEKFINSK